MGTVMPDWPPVDDDSLIDPDFDDEGGWSPDWLPDHQRDTSLDDWI